MNRIWLIGASALALLSASAEAQVVDGVQATRDFTKQFQPFGIDLAARDLSVKPGDNFGDYATGTWTKQTVIPADQTNASIGYDLYNLSQVQLRSLIETAPATTKIGAMYASFMNEAAVDALGAKPLAPDLATIAAVSDKAALARVNGASALGFGLPLFALQVYSDPNHAGMNALTLGQAGLGMPDRDYYLKPQFKPQLAAYRAYVERALTMAGYPSPAANADAIVAFETRIAEVSWALEDRRDIVKTNNPMTVSELAAYAPGFPWADFLAGAEVTDPGTIVVGEKSAIKAIAALYAETPLDTLKAWSAFQTVFQASPYLSKAFVDSRFDYLRTLSGVTAQRPRWKRGATLIDDTLGEELGHLYVDRYFPPSSKAAMETLVGNLKAAMADRIRNLGWMSPTTKAQALTKLAKMQVMVGYPDKWRDYSGLHVDPNDLYGNVKRASAFEWHYHLPDIGKPVDPAKWLMAPQTVDAYNGGTENKIVFPAGILQPPFFNPAADPAVNYGAIGAVIGHEITHAFDDQGRKIDETGKLRDWWTAEDAKRFEAQAAIYGKQYDGYEPVAGMHVNGTQTMGENIADLGGLLVAYDAYHRSLHGKPAPVLGGLTGDQRFFLAHAQVWRSKEREDALRQQITTDVHSPASVRAMASERDIDAWYAAFGVKPGDKNYIPPEQRARIW